MVTVVLALGMTWLGPPPTTGTPSWMRTAPPPPALAPLVPAPGREAGAAPREQTARPQR